MVSSSSSEAASPLRTTKWSSTIRTVRGAADMRLDFPGTARGGRVLDRPWRRRRGVAGGGEGQHDFHGCAFLQRAVPGDVRTYFPAALADARTTKMSSAALPCGGGVEAAAVVG